VLAPDDAPVLPPSPHVDSTLVKAIAFRWQKILETGRYSTIKEIAKAERINSSYSRVLRLTLLAPAIVEAAVDGRLAPDITLAVFAKRFALLWRDQKFADRDRSDEGP
jgi:hypothetical protein